MTEEIITILAQGGVAITTLIALYFVLQAISTFMRKNGNKNNNHNYDNLEKRVKKIENNDYHYLLSRVDRTDERLDKLEKRTSNDIQHQISAINERVDGIDGRLRKVEENLAVIKSKIQ